MSSPDSLNFSVAKLTNTSLPPGGNTLAIMPGADNIWRRCNCARTVPKAVGEAPAVKIGLLIKSLSTRESQSSAFLSTPGIDQLYSGVMMITPSALAI